MSTVEVTRRLSEERDVVLLGNSTDDKDRRLQRWRDKLPPPPRDADAATTSAAANAVKMRRDRSLIDKEPQVRPCPALPSVLYLFHLLLFIVFVVFTNSWQTQGKHMCTLYKNIGMHKESYQM